MHEWEDNIRLDPKGTAWEFVDWIHLAQDRDHWRALAAVVMNVRFHKRQGIS
jgi:hypothetical protein